MVSSPRVARTASVATFLVNAWALLAYHVYAAPEETESSTFWDRIQQGPQGLNTLDKVLVGALVTLAFELLDYSCKHSGSKWSTMSFIHRFLVFTRSKVFQACFLTHFRLAVFSVWLGSDQIPVRGKHLDVLTSKDLLFIGFSKANTAPFTYFYFSYVCSTPYVQWQWQELSLVNTLVALVVMFLAYDFVYTIMHGALHIPAVYKYIHKHHHTQKAPSRAVVDAVNVHPVEYLLGEYNHILALWFCSQFVVPVHAITTLLFLGVGGSLAAINHTRYDIVLSVWGVTLYDSKVHDVHHRIPQSNYGQYIMFWDKLFGTYR